MLVSEIKELTKNRSKVYIDGNPAFVLYKSELRTYQIQEGHEISEQSYQQIMQEVLPKRAKLRCMNLLKSREYTTEQLRKKLHEGIYPDNIIEEAIDYVESYHYLDDRRYVRNYITYQSEYKSRKCIEMNLLQKGIARDLIEDIYEELENDGLKEQEEQIILKILEKKHYYSENIEDSAKQKVIACLYRKGFSLDKIYKVLKKNDL